MNLQSLSNTKGARSSRKRLGRGRGNGLGKTCARGHKGQMSRKGHKRKLHFEGGQMPLIRRIPKRGFTNYTRVEYVPVNVSALGVFDDGAEVTLETLRAAGLIKGGDKRVKILGVGSLEKKLTIKAQGFSEAARSKIEAAGGTAEVVAAG